jgi:hypothetical protein
MILHSKQKWSYKMIVTEEEATNTPTPPPPDEIIQSLTKDGNPPRDREERNQWLRLMAERNPAIRDHCKTHQESLTK